MLKIKDIMKSAGLVGMRCIKICFILSMVLSLSGCASYVRKSNTVPSVRADSAFREAAYNSALPATVFQPGNTVKPVSCGDGICAEGETFGSCPQDCGHKVYPYAADVGTCQDSTGKIYPTSGEGASRWFAWGGCGFVKYYRVNANEPFIFYVFTDNCPDCVCYYPDFIVSELIGGVWVKTRFFDLPEGPGLSKSVAYVPRSSEIRVDAQNCFYLDVYVKN